MSQLIMDDANFRAGVAEVLRRLIHWHAFVGDDLNATHDVNFVSCPCCVDVLKEAGGRARYRCERTEPLP